MDMNNDYYNQTNQYNPNYPEHPNNFGEPNASDKTEPETENKEKRFNYLVSLKKKHLYLGSLFAVMMFVVFFFMGLFFGYQYSDQKIAHIINQKTSHPINQFETGNLLLGGNASGNIEETSLTSKIIAQNVGQNLNKESSLIFDQNISSGELLKKDLAEKTVQEKPIEKPTPPLTPTTPKVIPRVGKEYFYIQVVATSYPTKAKKIYNEFKKRKYPVKVKKGEKLGKEIYQIRLGLYQSKNRALRHLKLARDLAGFKEANLVRYRI